MDPFLAYSAKGIFLTGLKLPAASDVHRIYGQQLGLSGTAMHVSKKCNLGLRGWFFAEQTYTLRSDL